MRKFQAQQSQRERKREWYLRNKDRLREKAKEAYHQNIGIRRLLMRLQPRDLDAERRRSRAYRARNPARVKALKAEYHKRRLARDPMYRIVRALRVRLWDALNGRQKTGSAIKLLGCTVDELRQHLESQFKDGMTWGNWGRSGWHIDHKKPLVLFDLTDPAQLAEACHYSNLQPLWAIDNLKKGGKAGLKRGEGRTRGAGSALHQSPQA